MGVYQFISLEVCFLTLATPHSQNLGYAGLLDHNKLFDTRELRTLGGDLYSVKKIFERLRKNQMNHEA